MRQMGKAEFEKSFRTLSIVNLKQNSSVHMWVAVPLDAIIYPQYFSHLHIIEFVQTTIYIFVWSGAGECPFSY